MEVIRKKISMESARSRKQGILPYIPFNECDSTSTMNQIKYVEETDVNGNWGNFVINPYVNGEFLNYCELNRKYNRAIEILNGGVKTKQVVKNVFTGDDLSWSTAELSSGYCYSINFEYEMPVYEYYLAKESMFNFDGDILYIPTSKGLLPDSAVNVNIISDDDYNEFLTLDDTSYSSCKLFDKFIGRLFVDYEIEGPEVPVSIDYCDVLEWYNWMNNNKNSENCCIIKKWNDRGGQDMLDFLEKNKLIYSNSLAEIKAAGYLKIDDGVVDYRCIPTINTNILLTQDYEPESLAIPYLEDEDYDTTYQGLPYEYITDIDDYTADSLLMTLRDENVFIDDNDIELPGIFERFNKTSQGVTFDSAIFYYNDVTEQWEDTASNVYPDEYKIVDIAAAIPDDADKDDAYLVRFNNSPSSPMRIPYEINNPKNVYQVTDSDGNAVSATTESGDIVYEYVGDFILDIDTGTSGIIAFTYIIGGHFYMKKTITNGLTSYEFYSYINETGIKYNESFTYKEKQSNTYTIDGKDVLVYYNEIVYDDNRRIITNEVLGLTRDAYVSNIISMPMHDYFSEPNEDEVTDAPIIRPDYINGITSDIVTDIDITIGRGAAAAFERHFKLTECNTLEDLVNYGNNFFNL